MSRETALEQGVCGRAGGEPADRSALDRRSQASLAAAASLVVLAAPAAAAQMLKHATTCKVVLYTVHTCARDGGRPDLQLKAERRLRRWRAAVGGGAAAAPAAAVAL